MFTRTFSHRSQPSTPSAAPSFAVQRFIQPKLTVGPVDDPFEREADRVAERVVNRLPAGSLLPAPVSPATVQRQEAKDEEKKPDEEEGEMVRLKAAGPPPASGGPNVSPTVEAGIQQSAGGGRPLPEPVRGAMESAFGTDFHLVRVHADNRSDQLNRSLGARAFTTGTDVFFRGGEFQPDSDLGRRLIAHELTHVVQQSRGGTGGGRGIVQRAVCYVSGVPGPYEGVVAERGVTIAARTQFNRDQRADILTSNNALTANIAINLANSRNYHSDHVDNPLVTKDLLTHHLAEIDHIYPESRGGGNSVRNAQVLSQYENGTLKGNTYPWTSTRSATQYTGARVLLPEGEADWNVAAGGVLAVIGNGGNADIRLPQGSAIPQDGVLHRAGATLQAGTRLQTWMTLPANFPVRIPAGSQLPFFVRLGMGDQLPADLTLPHGFVPQQNIVLPLNTVHERTFTPMGPFGPLGPPQTSRNLVGGQVLHAGRALNGTLTLPAGAILPSPLTLPSRFVAPFDTSIQLDGAASPAVDFNLQANVDTPGDVTAAQLRNVLAGGYDLKLSAARANGLAPLGYNPL